MADFHSQIIGGHIDSIVEIIKNSSAKNIFIEQYQNCGGYDQPVKDMELLSDLAKELNKSITICVNLPRGVSYV